jgi:regulatory protein YycI of two-component signal transduction system YycFG
MCYLVTFVVLNILFMGFHINKKVADKKATTGAKNTTQGSSSKFIAKASTKSSGVSKKPIKTGGSRGS